MIANCTGAGFTKQENAVVQTTATALAGLAPSFTSGVLGMGEDSYNVAGGDSLPGNYKGPGNTVELTYPVTVAWCFAVAFFGFFLAFPFKTNMITVQRLTYPSGT